MDLLPRKEFSILFVMLADADEVFSFELTNGHTAETASKLW